MSSNYQEGDVIEVKIEKIVPRGLGLGFAEKLTVFVPLTVPGDVVSVSIRELKKRIAFAEIVEIKQPGPDRITPPCRYFGTCGGCNFQQLSYASQLEAKVAILSDCLRRIGKIEYTGEIAVVPSPNEFAYRSRARLHLDRTEHTIGYLARHSHDVVDIESCPILTPAMNATLAEMRSGIEWNSFFNDRIEVEVAEGDDGVVSISSAEFAEPAEEVSSIIGGERFAYTAETFFQANRVVAEQLVAAATDGLSGGTAFDLYCGVGLFSLPLARQFKSVIGVEGNSRAIGFARRNAKNAGLTNVEFADRGVETFLSSQRLPKPDLILLDPPRSGTEKQTIPRVAEFRPANIVYVSCEPSILARDLRTLLDAGYGIESITAFDLFPQTHHVETVVRLRKN